MKKLFLFLATIVAINFANAQNVNIPDANFKAYLVGNSVINTNGDTEISVAEAQAFTGPMHCTNLSIADLTGIEAFTALTQLHCGGNQLTSLDVSSNTALTQLWCDNNQLTSLNVSNNTALTFLRCRNNQLTSLNVSNNTALSSLSCSDNLLTSLDVSNNTALFYLDCYENQLTSLDVNNNVALTSLGCGNNLLTTLDMSNNTALIDLSCRNGQLNSLNVSNNTALTELSIFNNQLTTLDVSNNTALTKLQCHGNQLTSLDVSNHQALYDFTCNYNQLTTLDVSNNPALTGLNCSDNLLTSLNVANGNNQILTWFQAHNNPNLTCIQVDDADYSNTNWIGNDFQKDATASWSEDCSGTTGINEVNQSNITAVYPNPAQNTVTVTGLQIGTELRITNLLGETIYTTKAQSDTEIISVSHLASGLYFLNNRKLVRE